MADERLQSDGAIYTNNYKKQPNHPDWTGKVTLSKDILKELVTKMRSENADGAEMRVALWDRTSKAGNDYKYTRINLPKEPKPKPKPEPVDEFSDDIPF
jgi:hypothetical protein